MWARGRASAARACWWLCVLLEGARGARAIFAALCVSPEGAWTTRAIIRARSSLPTLATQAAMASKSNPSDFLKTVLGRPVVVKLNSGVDYRGVLACLDGYMNIAMEQTEEYQNGQLKAKYGDTFIRGNNVLYISTQKKKS